MWQFLLTYLQSAMAIYGPRGPGHAHQQYKPYHIQKLQHWKEKASETITALEANVDVMTALRKFYLGLKANKDFPSPLRMKCEDDIESFTSNIGEAIDRFKMHISRANLLGVTISDRKELVRLKSNRAL
jgi:hypothetical protein